MKIYTFSISLVALAFSSGFAQDNMTEKPKGPRGPKVQLIPFHAISKAAGFEIMRADKGLFNEMESLLLNVTKEANSKLPKTTNVIQLTYGYKKSGVSCVYLAPKVGSMSAEQVIKPLIDKKFFRDRQYFKGWCLASVPNSRLLIMVSGTTPEVRDAMIRGLR